jgi:hypothetical protein
VYEQAHRFDGCIVKDTEGPLDEVRFRVEGASGAAGRPTPEQGQRALDTNKLRTTYCTAPFCEASILIRTLGQHLICGVGHS